MFTIRPAQWPQDEAALGELDTSFETESIYRPVREGLTFRLVEETVAPPLHKRYEFHPADPAERRKWEFNAIAEADGRPAGFAAANHMAWNRRAVLRHLYVAPEWRGRGIGTKLIEALDAFARSVQARCLWLETQNVNYPGIQFYRRHGFEFCGFDESLYDPASGIQEEIAVFFWRPVSV